MSVRVNTSTRSITSCVEVHFKAHHDENAPVTWTVDRGKAGAAVCDGEGGGEKKAAAAAAAAAEDEDDDADSAATRFCS